MKYNRTKWLLEIIAGIVGIVYYTIIAGYMLIAGPMLFMIFDAVGYTSFSSLLCLFCFSILIYASIFALVVTAIVLSARCIRYPIDRDGDFTRTNVMRIFLVVLSFLSLNVVTAVLLIVAMCLKNFEEKESEVCAKSVVEEKNVELSTSIDGDLQSKVNELKTLLDLGIIDEATLKKSKEKIVKSYIEELMK